MKIIIIGAGEVGFNIAQKLSEENHDVVLIEKDPDKIKSINDELDIQVLSGSGTSPMLLKRAGIKDADMLVTATDSDEANLIACMLAQNLSSTILKVARIRNQEYLNETELFGKDFLGINQVIAPERLMAKTILSLFEIPCATEVINFEKGRVKLIGFIVTKDSPFSDRKLLSLEGEEKKLHIGAIVRGDEVIIPSGKDIILAGDLIYVVVKYNELDEVLKLFQVQNEITRRILIVGGGQIGTALALTLDTSRFNVKIIENDKDKCTQLAEKLDRVLVINGDGSDKALLQEVNIKDTDFIVATTKDDEKNILMSLLAKRLGVKRTITKVSKLSYVSLLSTIGLDTVISPRLSAVQAILQYIRRGKIISVIPLKGEHAEAIEAEAMETSRITDKPLAKVKFPKGAIVGAIIRGVDIIIPRGDSIVRPKDRLIIFALKKALPKLEKLLTVKLEYF